MGSDDGGNGDDADVFHGRLGLNARHITLVAVVAGYVQRSIREMNACSSCLFCGWPGRPKVTKDAVIARSRRSEPRFFSFLAGIAKPTFDASRATPLRFLEKSLAACPVLTRCEMLQHGYNGSEMGPYLYEASALSTTIALHCEVARVSNRCMC